MNDHSHEGPAITVPIRAALKDPSKPFGMLVQIEVKEGAQARWEAAYQKAAAQTRQEEGMLDYILYRSALDARRYILYERWRSLSDLEAHVQTPYIIELQDEVKAVASDLVEVRVLLPVEG